MIAAIRSILPILMKSTKYTPNTEDVDALSRLLNRMMILRSSSTTIRTIACKAVDEYKQPHQMSNIIVDMFQRKWGWNKEKLLDALELLWNEFGC